MYNAYGCNWYVYVFLIRQRSVCMRVLKIKTNKSESAHVCNAHMYDVHAHAPMFARMYIVRMGSLNGAPTSWWRRMRRGLSYSEASQTNQIKYCWKFHRRNI